MKRNSFCPRELLLLSLAALTVSTSPALAQTPTPAPPPSPAPVPTPTPASAAPEKKLFLLAELDQILAPIALYEDALLSQVLMAATYPLEVVEASRWRQANPGVTGQAVLNAVADKTWDVNVKSLVAFPSVLKQMNDHLDWTQKLGDALLGQQADVAASIQRLRAKAAAAGTLKSGAGPQYTVSTETQGSETVYVIAQSSPEVVYVPSYDPNTAYGAWSEPTYPPTYWPLGGCIAARPGVGRRHRGGGRPLWRLALGLWRRGWGNSYTTVNASRAVNSDRNFNRNNIGDGGRWQHQVDHRRGVAYRDPATRQHFGQNRPGAAQREQFRGQVQQRPAGPAGGGVQRPGAGAGNIQRPGARAGAGQRPGGGGALGGVNRGHAVNHESQRGRAQQQRSGGGGRPGGGGGARPGGGGGARPGGGGGNGARGGGGGGGARGGGGGGRR